MKKYFVLIIMLLLMVSTYLVVMDKPSYAENKNRVGSKLKSAYLITIRNVDKNDSDIVVLQAEVWRQTSAETYSYQWILPESATLLTGNLEGIVEASENVTYLEISVAIENWSDSDMILLSVKDDNHFGASAMWRPESMAEAEKEMMLQKIKPNNKIQKDYRIMQ